MNVAFDISLFGSWSNPHQRHIFGISRVVEENVHALLDAPDIDELWFLARHNVASTEEYYWKNLAPKANATLDRKISFAMPAVSNPFRSPLIALEHFFSKAYVRPPWKYLSGGRVCWWLTRWLIDRINPAISSRLNVYHSPVGRFPKWSRRAPQMRRLMTVHDLIPFIQPEHFNAPTIANAHRNFGELTKHDWALCVSESTRRDLLRFFPRVDPAKAVVIPLAANEHFRPIVDLEVIRRARIRYAVPEGPYFLSLCTVEPRKNVDVIIRAFARFCTLSRRRDVSLVFAGKVIEWPLRFRKALEDAGIFRNRIVFTGFVEDDDLPALYSGACAFIYMSRYEGFGLPVLEAMQCGSPVIASNSSSIPEVAGEAGILIDSQDEEALSETMKRLADDEIERRSLSVASVERARGFSWEKFGEQTLDTYRRAIDYSG